MRRIFLIVALTSLVSFVTMDVVRAQAPYRDTPTGPSTTETLRQPKLDNGFTGFIDLSRVQMNHTLGFGYASAGGQGYSQGYYMNTLSYRFNAPVMLRLRTGVTNNPFMASGSMTQPGQSALSSFFNNAEFFGGADVIWKPRDNVRIQLSVDRLPPGYYGYYNPYGFGSIFNDYRYDSAFGFTSRPFVPSGN